MTNIAVFDYGLLTPLHLSELRERLQDCALTVFNGDMEILPDADIILGNPDPKELHRCRRLKLLQTFSAGSDGYVSFMPKGAQLTNATGSYGLAISEHMLAMLLTLMKKLHLYGKNQQECLWRDEGAVTRIDGARALVVGLGDIGGEFAKRLHALGAHTAGIRRVGKEKPEYLDELYDPTSLDLLLPEADIVALCLPNTPQTIGLMNRERIGLMKKGAYLLNVGRGGAVDMEALRDALNRELLGGAGLDVTEPEPLPADHPLWKAKNLILTPHVSGGAHLPETVNRILSIAAYNVCAVLSGEPLRNEVDFSTGYRKLTQNS